MPDIMELVVMYGRILGLSADEMSKIAHDAQSAAEEFKASPASECVLAASCERDPKILWLGAVVCGYMIDTCTIKETEEGDVL